MSLRAFLSSLCSAQPVDSVLPSTPGPLLCPRLVAGNVLPHADTSRLWQQRRLSTCEGIVLAALDRPFVSTSSDLSEMADTGNINGEIKRKHCEFICNKC